VWFAIACVGVAVDLLLIPNFIAQTYRVNPLITSYRVGSLIYHLCSLWIVESFIAEIKLEQQDEESGQRLIPGP